jgi:hypothetical protein
MCKWPNVKMWLPVLGASAQSFAFIRTSRHNASANFT